MTSVFKTEQFYMPAKFLPPFQIGDRYCFPDNTIWEISGVSIKSLNHEHVKVTVHWWQPLHPTDEWRGNYCTADTNWENGSKHGEIWLKCGIGMTRGQRGLLRRQEDEVK